MPSSRALLAASAALVLPIGVGLARRLARGSSTEYVLHVYDHCPFCNRVEVTHPPHPALYVLALQAASCTGQPLQLLSPVCAQYLMQRFDIPYRRVLYGYGAGAKPEKCDGHGYGVGPLPLTGAKMLPVLEGPGVPCKPGALGMPESMEICAFLIGHHGLVVPCESGRADVKAFTKELTDLKPGLTEERMVRMPILDWADPRDVAYRRWKKKLPVELPPLEPRPELVAQVNSKLAELPAMLQGDGCLNSWGYSVDDVVLLPLLRVFTCVKGVELPPAVESYLFSGDKQMVDYRPHAL